MKSLLSLADLPRDDLEAVLSRAAALKGAIRARKSVTTLDGRVIGILFEKPSTRTRTSFETATLRLGGSPVYLSAGELQLSRGEPIRDTARILGGYLDAIVARVFSHDTLMQFRESSGVPVVNALSDLEHPTQAVSDLLTIKEAKGRLRGLTMAYIGDGNNVCNSLVLAAALTGIELRVACPAGYEPNGGVLARAKSLGGKGGGRTTVMREPEEAASGADLLYTDVWVSMGDEAEREKRMKDFRGYQVNAALLKLAKRDARVMHCLPAHRGLEITDEVIEGRRSIVWEQGENKLYGAAAVLEWALRGSRGRGR